MSCYQTFMLLLTPGVLVQGLVAEIERGVKHQLGHTWIVMNDKVH
jgi:hypothetical protein